MIPLFSSTQNREADNYAFNELKIPGPVLMENASRSIFETVVKNFDLTDVINPIGFIAGKGNNAGDGFAVARHFINAGFNVKVISLSDENTLTGDALLNYSILKNLIEKTGKGEIIKYSSLRDLNKLKDCALIFDALLGTGAKGSLRKPYDEIVKKINSFNTIKIAIDIPTGLNADTGYGEIIFDADLTVSLGEFKKGLFFADGKRYAGKVVKGYIGIGEEYFDELEVDTFLIEPDDAFFGLPKRKGNLHKYSAGKVLTIAGSSAMTGAPYFSATTPFFVGAGASILALPKSVRYSVNDDNYGLVYSLYEDNRKGYLISESIDFIAEKLNWADVITIGPGLGRNEETVKTLEILLKKLKGKNVVVDADGLYPLNNGEYKNYNLQDFVLTPHHGEFAALLRISTEELIEDLLEYGRTFARETKSWLVLKGAPTIIFTPEGEAFINTSGNSGMAKFGTGDVLSGAIAGIIAMSKSSINEDAIISAVYLHSLSADLLLKEKTEYGITAKDIMLNLPKAIGFLNESFL